MRKFTIILPDEVRQYQRFYWRVDWDDHQRFLVKLVGFELNEDGLMPIYLPRFSFQHEAGQFYCSFQLDNWRSLEMTLDRTGLHFNWNNLKKEGDDE
jgi:hypothetical protein